MRKETKQSLKVVPVDGNMTHILELSLRPGNGRAFLIKRDMLTLAKDITALKQCGIYFLYGETRREGKLFRKVYVGKAVSRKNGKGVFGRIKEHDNDNKPEEKYWTEAIAFVDNNNEWGATEVSYLENHFANLIASAKEGATFFESANGNTPNQGNVTKEMQWNLESYVEDAITILQTLRYSFFSKEEDSEPSLLEESSPNNPIEENNPDSNIHFFFKQNKGNICAEGIPTADGFLVFAGATTDIKTENKSVKPWVILLRKKHTEEGSFVNGKTTKDIHFSSPSYAAAFFTGYNMSGPAVWKTRDGKTLKEFEAESSSSNHE